MIMKREIEIRFSENIWDSMAKNGPDQILYIVTFKALMAGGVTA